jgi:hypothetical protein
MAGIESVWRVILRRYHAYSESVICRSYAINRVDFVVHDIRSFRIVCVKCEELLTAMIRGFSVERIVHLDSILVDVAHFVRVRVISVSQIHSRLVVGKCGEAALRSQGR